MPEHGLALRFQYRQCTCRHYLIVPVADCLFERFQVRSVNTDAERFMYKPLIVKQDLDLLATVVQLRGGLWPAKGYGDIFECLAVKGINGRLARRFHIAAHFFTILFYLGK